ncbi:MAG: cytochrome P450, partial [Actinomycetota bacterium]|nr:cytochrome P450 [Actinomycetota bacterium]
LDPTAFFARARQKHGDTFVVDAFGFRMVCVFSPEGVRSLYAQQERDASFGLATYRLIKFKMPEELLIGRRVTPHQLFGRELTETYLSALDDAMTAELATLGSEGTFEVFAAMRRVAHRLGLSSWGGPELAARVDELAPLLDQLDSAEAFVRPAQAFRTALTKRRRERAALADVERVIAEVLRTSEPQGFLAVIAEAWDGEPDAATGIARDLTLIHLGSLSNLYAALSWTVVDLLLRPELLEQVLAGDDVLLEQCANESIRIAQRSITLREVLRPVELDLGDRQVTVPPGAFLTTMLSVLNTTAAPGLEVFDPAHYNGRKLTVDLPAKELVSTFGHKWHTCPASRFSITAIRIAVRRMLDAYDLTPAFAHVAVRRQQIGGVARAARPVRVRYRAIKEKGP